MPDGEIRKGDIGTVFIVTVNNASAVLDISLASDMDILFQKPSGNITRTASFTTDGTDGKMQYATIADDLDVAGSWKIQGRVTLPSGTWSTTVSTFRVYDNLD